MIKIKTIYIIVSLLVFSHCQKILGQNRWVKTYHEELNTPALFIANSYDKGSFISGRQIPSYPRYNWLIKTDINGEILWEKTIGNGVNTIILREMIQDADGSLYSCGMTYTEDSYGDPFVLKLNQCGEKEWCYIFHTDNQYDKAQCITLSHDGGCTLTLNYTDSTLINDRICLANFSSSGEFQWRKCMNSMDSLLGNEDDENLILTPDKGFLITGWCYYTNPEGTLSWLHPYYIKTDSLGNFEWETVAEKETGASGGQAWQTCISPDSQYYYSSISHYYHDSTLYGSSPALLKMDLLGNVIGIYDIADTGIVGKLFDAHFINDSLQVASASWGDPDINTPMAIIMDTLANIKSMVSLLDNSYMSYVRPTYDTKILFYTQFLNEEDEDFDVYLFKLNQNLEQDTVYTMPFVYDSLCPYPILSDTIVPDDCGLIVNIDETLPAADPPEADSTSLRHRQLTIVFHPNPAKDEIYLQFTVYNLQFAKENRLEIFDVFGRKMLSQAIPRNQDRLRLDISAFPAGLYIAIVKSGNNVTARAKFVAAR